MSKRSLAFGTIVLAMLASVPVARAGDEIPRQVFIQARIIVANHVFARELGVRFGFETAPGNTPADSPFSNEAPLFDPNASYENPWIGGLPLSDTTLGSQLSALEQEGQARILSAPKITTTDGKEARIEIGETVRYAQEGSTAASTAGGELSLVITPVISNDGMLDLEIEALEAARMVPPLEQRMVKTRVTMPDRGTLVLGGLFRDRRQENESPVPVLRDVPGLGWLFRNEGSESRRRELLILITPQIEGVTGGGRGGRRSTDTDRPAGTRQQQQIHRPRPDPNQR